MRRLLSVRPLVLGLVVLLVLVRAYQARAGQNVQGLVLKIVVIEGEGAVNVIQQKTAVAPVVEIRDRNDQPVAGAVVTFAIRGGRATFSGVRTLTLTTNAVGRAAVTGFTPTGSGGVQISASALFRGQTAVTTITQTNVLTAAEGAAASAGSGAASGTVGGGGAGAGGGGISHTALIGIAAGASAGALVAVNNLGGNAANVVATTYVGSYSGEERFSRTGDVGPGAGIVTCSYAYAVNGTLTMTLTPRSDGLVTGTAQTTQLSAVFTKADSSSPLFNCGTALIGSERGPAYGIFRTPAQVTGTRDRLTATDTQGSPNGETQTTAFSGALDNGVVSGVLTFLHVLSPVENPVLTTFPVTLR